MCSHTRVVLGALWSRILNNDKIEQSFKELVFKLPLIMKLCQMYLFVLRPLKEFLGHKIFSEEKDEWSGDEGQGEHSPYTRE